jgi:DNA primase
MIRRLITLKLTKETIIKYPNRLASFLRNSPFLSQFDGDSFLDLEKEESKKSKERLKKEEIKKIAEETKTTAQVLRASKKKSSIKKRMSRTRNRPNPATSASQPYETTTNPTVEHFDMTVDDEADEEMLNLDVERERRKEQRKQEETKSCKYHIPTFRRRGKIFTIFTRDAIIISRPIHLKADGNRITIRRYN